MEKDWSQTELSKHEPRNQFLQYHVVGKMNRQDEIRVRSASRPFRSKWTKNVDLKLLCSLS
jgi:hypothetical protein